MIEILIYAILAFFFGYGLGFYIGGNIEKDKNMIDVEKNQCVQISSKKKW